MPQEISEADYRQFLRYQDLGTVQEITKKISDLENDNKTQRDQIRDLKAAQPAEGTVALLRERADALAAYEALGKPEDLTAALAERDTLRTKDAQRTRQDSIRAVVEAAGWPAETVATLEDMRSLDGATFEVKTEKNDKGEEVRTPYLTLAGEGAQPQKLTDFASTAPQLKGLKTATEQPKPPTQPTYPRQAVDGAPRKGDATPEDHQKSVAATATYVL